MKFAASRGPVSKYLFCYLLYPRIGCIHPLAERQSIEYFAIPTR